MSRQAEETIAPAAGVRSGILHALPRWLVRPYQRAVPPQARVAIVVPLSSRPDLLPDEEISLRHLEHFLGAYDKYFVSPAGHPFRRPGFGVVHFADKYFGSAAAHARLVLSRAFYEEFEKYEYILIYHLDALVFSDQLVQWCEAGFDYIGAPWIPCADTPWVTTPAVGNGGFTLMKVESALKVLHHRYRQDPATFWLDILTRNVARLRWLFSGLERLRHRFPGSPLLNRIVQEWHCTEKPELHGRNSDLFWSFQAIRYLPHFKIAPVDTALRFAFEAAPRQCFEMNGLQLPFGCHAWMKFDPDFWKPFILAAAPETDPLTYASSSIARKLERSPAPAR
jgi:hypothetical protein